MQINLPCTGESCSVSVLFADGDQPVEVRVAALVKVPQGIVAGGHEGAKGLQTLTLFTGFEKFTNPPSL
jgi:hypothetical protein